MTIDELQIWMKRYKGMSLNAAPGADGLWNVILTQGKRVSDGRAAHIEQALEIAQLKHETSWKLV